jgi:hypothetical protein
MGKSALLTFFQYKCDKKVIYNYNDLKFEDTRNAHSFTLHPLILKKSSSASITVLILLLGLLNPFVTLSIMRMVITSKIITIREAALVIQRVKSWAI